MAQAATRLPGRALRRGARVRGWEGAFDGLDLDEVAHRILNRELAVSEVQPRTR